MYPDQKKESAQQKKAYSLPSLNTGVLYYQTQKTLTPTVVASDERDPPRKSKWIPKETSLCPRMLLWIDKNILWFVKKNGLEVVIMVPKK